MNGTTDYLEMQGYSDGTTIQVADFSAILSASGNGIVSGTGASALSALADVTLSSPASGQVLTFNGTNWVNVTPSATTTISGTTTMVANWPDAILCTMGGATDARIFYAHYMPQASTGRYWYRSVEGQLSSSDTATYVQIGFNSNQSYYMMQTANTAYTSGGTCDSKSISQLYSSGQAFNFIGGSGQAGGALGDRLTSGTLAVTTNSATSIISLSTAGTTWGYLGSAASYIPNLATNNISLSTINGVSVSALGGGASPTNVPAFRVHKNSTAQTGVPATTWTKITFSTKDSDTYNNFNTSTSRFQPTIAGHYLITGNVSCGNTVATCYVGIFKNGSGTRTSGLATSSSSQIFATTSDVIYMNGTTDYVELFGYTSGSTFDGSYSQTNFSGSLLASGNGLVSNGAGVSAMSSLTDVTLTSPVANSILVYDGSKWVNKFIQDTVSTSTMVSGWPDAIVCTGTSQGSDIYYNSGLRTSTNRMLYAPAWDDTGTSYGMWFNASTGAYVSGQANFVGACANKSISQLYAEGRAFNFVGGAANGAALGDRLTSGTLAVTTNSATSIISLSTAGTTWGYLGSAASYIPNLATNNISLSTINGVSVSALGGGASPTNVPAFRAVKSASQSITASTWTKMALGTKVFDTYNNFDTGTGRFTPTIAGYYYFTGSVSCDVAGGCYVGIYKNGAQNSYAGSNASGVTSQATSLIYMNGSTDYVELWAYSNGSGPTISSVNSVTYLTGSLIASGNGLISGTTANTDRIVSGSTSVIANTAGSVAINAPVTVSGRVSASTVQLSDSPADACNSASFGTFKMVNGRPYVCRQ
ncbi:MAG: hypothetical protein DI628_08745 [Blastochloris viridis]|uniref:C1q domain-containing protein n=1 Tax=Blastochloris viridis TaxID=1079 RepID=A0A6N4RCI6_BLAVI|nr:MAG: hypothetical protein DI628_08745 [Blastochloris viridis]